MAKQAEEKLTYQDLEKALVNSVKSGINNKKPKDGKYMQDQKAMIKKIRQTKDPQAEVTDLFQIIFPINEKYKNYKPWYEIEPPKGYEIETTDTLQNLYKRYYMLAKDSFISTRQIDEETEAFLNS